MFNSPHRYTGQLPGSFQSARAHSLLLWKKTSHLEVGHLFGYEENQQQIQTDTYTHVTQKLFIVGVTGTLEKHNISH